MKTFYQILANNLVASTINFTVWFAITFFTFLETRSVFATSIISGIYLVATAGSGIWLGSLVDHYKKKIIMIYSSLISLLAYIICFFIYVGVPAGSFKDPANPILWIFVVCLMFGVLAGSIRNIALPTLVTILIDEDKRDKANGLSGSAFGISFLLTSVFSGLLVGSSGMYWVLILAVVLTLVTILHLFYLSIPEKGIAHLSHEGESVDKEIDLKGTWKIVAAVPGLVALIFFTTFNNFLGGVFMSLMDAYGLSLVSVQMWGFLWGFLSTGFILGGLIIAKVGLGKNPVKALFLANIIIWIVSCFFTIYPSIILLTIGMYIYILVMPYIEASEQTIIQKVVPLERQGRVFGFAQSVEQAASPLTAFLMGPIAQFIFIPFMTTGAGVKLIGSWFGSGPDRGIALLFTLTGIIGLIITLVAFSSKYYSELSARYLSHKS